MEPQQQAGVPFTSTAMTAPSDVPSSGRSNRRALRLAAGGLLVVLVFVAGIGVGDGRLSLHRTEPVAKGLPAKLNYASVNQVYQALKQNYDGQLTETQLEDGLKHGLAQATNDPYTVYFTAAEAKSFNQELNNSFSGIGAQLGEDSNNDLEIIAPINGLPAAKAGLKAQDIITSINGTSTTGMSIDDAVNDIRGPKGSKVTLQILRDQSQPLTFTVTRDNIVLPSVTTKILPGNIGYMQISTFADDTTSLAQKAADSFKSQNVKGIVLDLRDNPGGLLDAAVHVSSLWLPQGQMVLQEKRGSTVVQTYQALGGDELNGIPTVVLIDGGSASASEITTGALHDNGDAYVIGQKSYGKGVVQEIVCIGTSTNSDGTCPAAELKVTVASWYRPDGKNINHLGITPDKTVTVSDADAAAGTDTQLQAAEAYLASKQ
jgi:carboxyl-terminal processing protease